MLDIETIKRAFAVSKLKTQRVFGVGILVLSNVEVASALAAAGSENRSRSSLAIDSAWQLQSLTLAG
jgi:hypothetical protein